MQKVVHYIESDLFGGCEEVTYQILLGLDKDRWQPILFHHDEEGIHHLIKKVRDLGIQTYTVPRINSRNIIVTLPKFIRKLRGVKADIFHAHLSWPLGCRYGLIAAKFSLVPVIVATSHLYSPISGVPFGGIKMRLQSAIIDRFIAVSEEVKRCLCRELFVQAEKVSVVYNGIAQVANFILGNPNLKEKLIGSQTKPFIFTPARLHPQKGHKFLLEAAVKIPEAIFVLAGEGPERDTLEKLAKKLGIENRVRFLGYRENIQELMACCDLFVLPSLFEGLPISVLEAMAAGKPIVATSIGGTNEAIVNGESGLLVPAENPKQLAIAIRTILSDNELAVRLGKAAKLRAEKMFSSEAMVRGLTQLYEELLSK